MEEKMEKEPDQRLKARKIAENAGEDTWVQKEKLEWMYGQKENQEEEHLLGKAVKDDLDFCREEEKRVADSFGAIYTQRDSGSMVQVDMAAKLREDPMGFIKKNDDDAWRKIYDNPVKMAQLRIMVKGMMDKKKRKNKRKKLKEEKRKKEEKEGKEEKGEKKKKGGKWEDESSDSDDSSGSSDGSSDNSSDEPKKKKKKSDKKQSSKSNSPRMLAPSYITEEKTKSYGLIKKGGLEVRGETSSSDYNQFLERRKMEEEKKLSLTKPDANWRQKKKLVMTEEEMEEKRQMMMSNAKERDVQRKSNVKQYQDQDAAEIKKEVEGREKAGHFEDSTQPDFVRPLVGEAYKSTEERIKRNIYRVQRSKADQDKNFAKR